LALEAAASRVDAEAPCENARQSTPEFILIAPHQLRSRDMQGVRSLAIRVLSASTTKLIQKMILTRRKAALNGVGAEQRAVDCERKERGGLTSVVDRSCRYTRKAE
jgi:hypothetical protein